MSYVIFPLGLSLLLAHEMDAIRRKEWLGFPVIASSAEETGHRVFTGLHIPLYALLLWGLVRDGGPFLALIAVMDAFLIIHMLLHILLRNLPHNQFKSVFSWGVICGSGSVCRRRFAPAGLDLSQVAGR